MPTYNHEKYIAEALDSVLMQQTDFSYDIVIAEDCSTDGTRAIIQQYEKKYPDLIHPIYHEKNVGGHKTSEEAVLNCTGDYIALLEGDDYWTDPLKLQKQVELLDSNADMSLCFHPTVMLDNGKSENSKPISDMTELSFKSILRKNPAHSQTLMFKTGLFKGFPDWMLNSGNLPGDYFYVLTAAKAGRIGYINEYMSVYRIHDKGVWGAQDYSKCLKIEIQMNQRVRQWLEYSYFLPLTNINLSLRWELLKHQFRSFTSPARMMWKNSRSSQSFKGISKNGSAAEGNQE